MGGTGIILVNVLLFWVELLSDSPISISLNQLHGIE